MKNRNIILTTILIALGFLALSPTPNAFGVVPVPDGGYPGGNTAEGTSALLGLTTGTYNTALGLFSLRAVTDGKFNTGVGAGTLFNNTADANTATGAGALLSNSIGASNTANGTFALFNNTSGNANTADGRSALFGNTTGIENTAVGDAALGSNEIGSHNTAVGVAALAVNTLGNNNTAIGQGAGFAQTIGNNNVYIGAGMAGVAGENNACYIASIFGQTSPDGLQVFITSNNKLGTVTSSKRFKEDIKPMDQASEAILALKPVAFRYKKEIASHGQIAVRAGGGGSREGESRPSGARQGRQALQRAL